MLNEALLFIQHNALFAVFSGLIGIVMMVAWIDIKRVRNSMGIAEDYIAWLEFKVEAYERTLAFYADTEVYRTDTGENHPTIVFDYGTRAGNALHQFAGQQPAV